MNLTAYIALYRLIGCLDHQSKPQRAHGKRADKLFSSAVVIGDSIENWYRDYSMLVITAKSLFVFHGNGSNALTHDRTLFAEAICTIISDKSFKVQTYNCFQICRVSVLNSLVFIIRILRYLSPRNDERERKFSNCWISAVKWCKRMCNHKHLW